MSCSLIHDLTIFRQCQFCCFDISLVYLLQSIISKFLLPKSVYVDRGSKYPLTSISFKGMIGSNDILIARSNQNDQFDVK